jgi:Protein of unknown function (DUF3443)
VRKYLALVSIQVLILAGCSGGGGGYGGGGGGGGGGGMSACTGGSGGNVEPVIVNQGPTTLTNPAANVPYVSVKICVPGSSAYQTVDHIQVDTGSSGLRIIASALNTITLQAVLDGSGHPMAECLPFADGSSWGSLQVADIQLPGSGKIARSVTVQLIGDPAYEGNNRPASCTGVAEDSVQIFEANGILGVGPFVEDCGPGCVSGAPASSWYYGCPTPASCAPEDTASLAAQVQNPVTLFAADNNGVILQLPAVGAAGSATVSGSLVWGIGTQANNALGAATVLTADPNQAFITANHNGVNYPDSYLDSGSNGIFFNDTVTPITQCGPNQMGFYCPTTTLPYTFTLTGTNAVMAPAPFDVANAQTLFQNNPGFAAFSNLGGVNPDPTLSLDLGLPFFYGRNVYTAVEGVSAGGTMGPYYAF